MARTPDAAKVRRDAAEKLLDQQEKHRQRAVEHSERLQNSQPTPTQRENDLAALGVANVDKEDDGSGPELVHARVVVAADQLDERGVYNTRAMSSPTPADVQQAARVQQASQQPRAAETPKSSDKK